MTRMMRELVEVQGGFKPSVQLPGDFFDEELNRHFVENYIPNEETLDIFKSIRDGLLGNAETRARIFAGTFGTGKSDLMLMVANYLTRSATDPLLAPFFERLRRLNDALAESIYQARLHKPPFLLVLLQADIAYTFSGFVLHGLAQSLAKDGVEHLLGKTYYRAALDQIETWEKQHPDNVRSLERVLTEDYPGRSLERIKTDLNGPRADAALEVFRSAVLKAIGMPFAPTAVIQRPSDAFVDVAKQLVDSQKYSGIVVIADEFTDLLKKLADSETGSDSKAIDNLAEAAVRSGYHQLHFYTVSLHSFASVQGSTQISQSALERIGGRFKEFSLKSQNSEELISVAIGKLAALDKLFADAPGQVDDLLTLSMRLWANTIRKERAWLNKTIVHGCFPLHPLTTYCLPHLNAVLAQNQRTMFNFIWDEERGLRHFVEHSEAEPKHGWISLLTLDRLFDYFETNLQEKRQDIYAAYRDAIQSLTPEQAEQGLEGRLLRALVMLDVANQANQRADRETLRHAVGLSIAQQGLVVEAMQQLEAANIVYLSRSGYYQLVKPGRANPLELKRAIELQVQSVSGSALERLNAQYPPDSIKAVHYNSERGTDRQLIASFVSPAGMESPANLNQALQDHEGIIWYVITNSDKELEFAHSIAIQLTRQHLELVVAIPRNPTDLLKRLRQKQAFEAIKGSSDYQTSDYQDLLRDGGPLWKDYIESFQVTRQMFELPQNFEWYRDGRTILVTTSTHISNHATIIMDARFSATPPHKTSQHLKPDIISKAVKDATEHILQAPFKMPMKQRKPEFAVLLNGAGILGLIEHKQRAQGYDEYEVCPPTIQQKESRRIWIFLEEELQKGTPWSQVASTLANAPYGLYPSVLQIFIAVFYRFNQDYLEIYETTSAGGRPIDVTANEIEKIVKTPTKYIFRYEPLHDTQKKFLRGLAECALYPNRPVGLQKGETASLRNQVAKLLRLWSETELAPLARRASQAELTALAPDMPAAVLDAAEGLMEAAAKPQIAEVSAAILENLSVRVGLTHDNKLWDDQQLGQALATLEGSCLLLKGVKKRLQKQIVEQIAVDWGLSELPKNWDDVLKAVLCWRHEKVRQVNVTHLGGSPDGRVLLSLLDDRPYNFEFFLNALPHRWGYGIFDQWQTISIRDTYLLRLKKAKADIEAKAIELGPTAIKTDSAPLDELYPSRSMANSSSATQLSLQPVQDTKQRTESAAAIPTAPQSDVARADRSINSNVTKAPSSQTLIKSAVEPEAHRKAAPAVISTMDEAFAHITKIINQLSSNDQRVLWARLVNEYDPQ